MEIAALTLARFCSHHLCLWTITGDIFFRVLMYAARWGLFGTDVVCKFTFCLLTY